MAVFGFMKRPEAIATREEFEDFLDSNAAFVVQRCLYEYSRAAAGYGWQPLMEEKGFQDAMERGRWLAYPLGLAAVAEVAEGILRPHAGTSAPRLLEAIEISCARVLDRHSPPEQVNPADWTGARSDVAHRLSRLQAAPVKPVKDIPKSISAEVFALVPIHERLRGRDPWLVQNNLTVNLLKVHEDFEKRADLPALADVLTA